MTDKVVPLGRDPEPASSPPPPSRHPRIQGLAIGGMTLFAVIGAVAALSLFTVGFSPDTRRYVVAVVLFSAVGFLACSSAAVLAAARQTYADGSAEIERD